MPDSRITSVCLVLRSQIWFRASVRLDTLTPFNVKAMNEFAFPNPGSINLRCLIGRGPCDYEIGAAARFHFDHGEEAYPVFSWPSVGPKGAGLHASTFQRKLVLDRETAVFCLEASTSIPADPELFNRTPDLLTEADKILITECLTKIQNIVHSLAGAYSLYQYPLVWDFIDERHQWTLINLDTRTGKAAFEQPKTDNWVPFKLDVGAKIDGAGLLRDGIAEAFGQLLKEHLKQPFIFLKDSMWHTDIRTRFLLQFWIIEHYADKYTHKLPPSENLEKFVQDLEAIVNDKFPSFADYFKRRKGDLTRLTLSQKVEATFQTMRIKYDDKLFKRAKAVRDCLSHASEHDENELIEMELYVRELVRHLIRRDLELQGIFLDGQTKSQEELVQIVPAYPPPSARLARAFGPLSVT